jgi:hypothetical protein
MEKLAIRMFKTKLMEMRIGGHEIFGVEYRFFSYFPFCIAFTA